MNLLDIHFRSGETRVVENVDHCRCGDGYLNGYHRDRRLILRVALHTVDYFEVREGSAPGSAPSPCPLPQHSGRGADKERASAADRPEVQ
jgi:hypothetical protein